MTNPTAEVLRAANFAAQRHAAQKRKGTAQEPYINHLLEVAGLLADATGGQDATLIIAGLLHDTIEDVGVTPDELVREFGPEVTDLVLEVTDDKSLQKAVRKQLQVEHAPHKSRRAKMLKMADKISNLRALTVSPPPDWEQQRIVEYFAWAQQVVQGCRDADPTLAHLFDETHRIGVEALTRA